MFYGNTPRYECPNKRVVLFSRALSTFADDLAASATSCLRVIVLLLILLFVGKHRKILLLVSDDSMSYEL